MTNCHAKPVGSTKISYIKQRIQHIKVQEDFQHWWLNCDAKRGDRALARGVRGGAGGWPPGPGGGCKGAAPPCLRKFCILQAKYA